MTNWKRRVEIPKSNMFELMGDFNAKTGKENTFENVAGKQTIHEKTSDNRKRLCNLRAATNTYIISTRFNTKKYIKTLGRDMVIMRVIR